MDMKWSNIPSSIQDLFSKSLGKQIPNFTPFSWNQFFLSTGVLEYNWLSDNQKRIFPIIFQYYSFLQEENDQQSNKNSGPMSEKDENALKEMGISFIANLGFLKVSFSELSILDPGFETQFYEPFMSYFVPKMSIQNLALLVTGYVL
jgi:hypothetical protein